MKRKNAENLVNLLYMPAVILILIFVVYPLISGIQISLRIGMDILQNTVLLG